MHTTIVWFRQDLRLADNPALHHAIDRGAVVPVFIWTPEDQGKWSPGGARKWWLHEAIKSLAESLEDKGSRLILRQGDPLEELIKLAKTAKADCVTWNRRYEPELIERDKQVKRGLADADIQAESHNGLLLFEPWQVETKQGKPYQVFTPFHRAVQALPGPSKPFDKPSKNEFKSPAKWPDSITLESLGLLPNIKWYEGMAEAWKVDEDAAMKQFESFLDDDVEDYKAARDIPAEHGTSRMSPYLHHGMVSPRQLYHATMKRIRGNAGDKLKKNAYDYIRELVWREFGYHVLYHFPHTPNKPLRDKYETFPWIDMRQGRHYLEAWQKGKTGYPIVDAGMRELWHTGWMHNRVRMIVASFLTKHLLISWHEGAKWFWDTLVDADLANNTLGWQWAAGCGADAAPYFRIFNPMTQGEKFDKQGDYVRKWCPELKDVPNKYIHEPWECPPMELQAAGVTLGEDYPEPIVNHKEARGRALEALSKVTGD